MMLIVVVNCFCVDISHILWCYQSRARDIVFIQAGNNV